jgi:hypothetical protein
LKGSLREPFKKINNRFETLPARPATLDCYVGGKALYDRIAATELFSEGLERLLRGVENYQIALMCAEKYPVTCHRSILICQHLRQFEIEIQHILSDGQLESHQQLEYRLLKLHSLVQPEPAQQEQLSLFDGLLFSGSTTGEYSESAALKEAYQQQGDDIAYVEKTES